MGARLIDMSETEQTQNPRQAQPDEPQVTHYITSKCGSYNVSTKTLHIEDGDADEPMPLCNKVTRSGHPADDGARWRRKSIKVRPYSWRQGRWCESCLREYDERSD